MRLARITKRFGATLAVDDVSFDLPWGRVHALLGENGAGKTTLMRIAFGLTPPDSGRVTIAGSAREIRSPHQAIGAGVGMVHQHFTNVPALSVAENVALGGRGRFDFDRASARVTEIGNRAGLSLAPGARVGALSVGAQQRLEIVKALARDARILILDEPTAVLAPAEADDLLAWLRRFADQGNAVVLITHKLREALAIADDVTVLRRGRKVLERAARELSSAILTGALLGEDAAAEPRVPVATPGSAGVVAALDTLYLFDERGVETVHGASLTIHAGDLVGLAAIEGAGQHELLRAFAGRHSARRGALQIPANVAFIPEDRHRDALVLDFSLAENVALRAVRARRGLMHWSAIRRHTAKLIDNFDVRGGSPRRAARVLSGGNQQKLVLARELDAAPALVVAENPTRGLDVRAMSDVHRRLREAAAGGAGVIVYSSDLDEVFALATRIVVMYAGTLRELPLDRERVGRALLGVD